MAKITNTIAEKPQQPANLVEYMAGDEKIKLTPDMVKRFLVNGGGNITNEELYMFMNLCRFQHLNPFTREVYLIKYGDRNPATMVVGKDVHLKRAKRHPEFAGLQAGIILQATDGNCYDREGTFYNPESERLVGGWARVKIHGWDVDLYNSVSLREYIGRKSSGEVNGQWASKPATMIRKVAIVQALREAFPEDTAGMYVQEELPEAQAVRLDEQAVVVDAEIIDTPKEEPKKETPKTEAESVADALFEG